MSVSYQIVERRVAKLMNALATGTVAAVETAYLTSPLTTTQITSPRDTMSFIRDAILDAEMDLIAAICSSAKHPERASFYAYSGTLAYGDLLPASIGPYGNVRTVTSHTPLEVRSLSAVRRRFENVGSVYTVSAYEFAIEGNRIFHTAPQNVELEIAAPTRPQLTVFSTNPPSNIRVLDHHVNALVAIALMTLPMIEGWNPEMAGAFAGYAQQYLQWTMAGAVDAPPVFPALPEN